MKSEIKGTIFNEKQAAGYLAADYVKDGMIIGLGTGSTVAYTMERLSQRIKEENLSIKGVPTSIQTMMRARDLGIPLVSPGDNQAISITIDGADQIDNQLRLIKGRGAAQVRERIIADASELLIIVADGSKLCDPLSGPIPVETIPFAMDHVMLRLTRMGGQVQVREGVKKDGPVISDNGNIIMDYYPGRIYDPDEMETMINTIPGVVSCGIFTEFSDKTIIIIGEPGGTRIISK